MQAVFSVALAASDCTFIILVYCSWGIGAKVANDSMRTAAATLAEYASKGGQGDVDG